MNAEDRLKLYRKYLENCTDAPGSVNNYSQFSRIDGWVRAINPEFKGFAEIDNSKEAQVLYDTLDSMDLMPGENKSFTKVGNAQYSNAVSKYIKFLKCFELFSDNKKVSEGYDKKELDTNFPLQQIFYGAPGTGKSHKIDDITKNESVIRTTFHPDSDYSTFVGAYKPTMGLLPICDELGQPMKIGETVLHKEQIVYEFVDQAFLQAYVQAWKNIIFYNGKKQYLVIEEINRGNCAQIFGDLFQLLDRNSAGFSDYPINADKDLQKYLKKVFARMDEPDKQIFLKSEKKQRINSLYKGDEDIVCKVLSGEILLLPNNLYIWATMNTSDQSLFPIDSAFKRRWEWKYVPIKYSNTDWRIELGDKMYSWVVFQEKINGKIKDATDGSEDKQIGDFFVKAKNNVIDEDLLLNKIVFYLWNDVCKDGDGDIFKIEKDDKAEDITFSQLFKDSTTKLQQWMEYLKVGTCSDSKINESDQNQENPILANDEIN